MNKSFMTNFISAIFVLVSFVVPDYLHIYFLNCGMFALSGAVTNQLAIHMLFEKVPFLYGSGVIALNFEVFKSSIKNMMMSQFFSRNQLNSFFEKEEQTFDFEKIIKNTDFSPAFEALSSSVMESKFGGMISMFGGASLIESLKEPFIEKLKNSTIDITKSSEFKNALKEQILDSSAGDDILNLIENMIDRRLNELSPEMVKEIVYKIMSSHLGWLVVWGGVFGGIIGLLGAFLL